jgi:signal peptidase
MRLKSLIQNTALAVICLLLVIPILIYTFPFLAGADGSYTVMSGSMSPAIRPGDLIIVRATEPADIQIGDILTIRSQELIFTHRVVERLEGDRFRLKGDANEEPDPGLIEESQIIGKVVLVFPFGHLYTPYGFASSLLVPAALIIGKQMHTIHQHTKRRSRRETMRWRRESRRSPMVDTSTVLLGLILVASTSRIIAPHFVGGASSYFSDTERGWGFFSAGIWEVGATVDIKPDTLNLDSEREWITAYIETEYDETDIVVDSVMLDGVIKAEWGEVQEDGRLMVKFDGASVIEYLEEEDYEDEVTLTVSGSFTDGTRFKGKDTIVVID